MCQLWSNNVTASSRPRKHQRDNSIHVLKGCRISTQNLLNGLKSLRPNNAFTKTQVSRLFIIRPLEVFSLPVSPSYNTCSSVFSDAVSPHSSSGCIVCLSLTPALITPPTAKECAGLLHELTSFFSSGFFFYFSRGFFWAKIELSAK